MATVVVLRWEPLAAPAAAVGIRWAPSLSRSQLRKKDLWSHVPDIRVNGFKMCSQRLYVYGYTILC